MKAFTLFLLSLATLAFLAALLLWDAFHHAPDVTPPVDENDYR